MLDKEGFANRLRSTRESLRLKQEDVAARLGVGRTGYAAYESGKSVPPLESIMILLDILDVSFEWLTKGVGEKKATSVPTNENVVREMELKYMKALETLVSQKDEIISQKDEIISLKEQLLEREKVKKEEAQKESQKL